jgi:hypothetical protein
MSTGTVATTTAIESPVMTFAETAAYCRRTMRAMYALRDRRTGPPSFRKAGRLYCYKAEVDEWLASGHAADPGSNPDLDPVKQAPEPRRATRTPGRHTHRNGDRPGAVTPGLLAEHAPTNR